MWLDRLEDAFVQHFLTRPVKSNPSPREIINDRFERIRFWLKVRCDEKSKAREALAHIDKLMKGMSPELPDNPLAALKQVCDELREDWGEFWTSEDPEGVGVIEDDLDALRALEPMFANADKPDVYKQYREILKAAGEFYSALPMLPRGRLTEKMRETLHNKTSKLFSSVEALMAPKDFEFQAPGEPEMGLGLKLT